MFYLFHFNARTGKTYNPILAMRDPHISNLGAKIQFYFEPRDFTAQFLSPFPILNVDIHRPTAQNTIFSHTKVISHCIFIRMRIGQKFYVLLQKRFLWLKGKYRIPT